MRTALVACALVFWTSSVGYATTDGQLKVIDSISGRSVLAIRAALPEIDRVKLKLSEYRVTVAEDGSSIYVTCSDPAKGPEVRGGGGRMLGFTVELSKDDLRIIKSYYSR
jgi:hypothetical protein